MFLSDILVQPTHSNRVSRLHGALVLLYIFLEVSVPRSESLCLCSSLTSPLICFSYRLTPRSTQSKNYLQTSDIKNYLQIKYQNPPKNYTKYIVICNYTINIKINNCSFCLLYFKHASFSPYITVPSVLYI